MQEQAQVNKKKRFVFEQYRQTNQRMRNVCKKQFKSFEFEQYRQTNQRMRNVHKKQFKSFEISGEEISFQIMSFYFHFIQKFCYWD